MKLIFASECPNSLSAFVDETVFPPLNCFCIFVKNHLGFPSGSVVKNPICQAGRRHRFNAWVRKIPKRKKWQLTPVFLPGKPHGQRSLVGYSPWGYKRVRHELASKQHRITWTYLCELISGCSFPLIHLFNFPLISYYLDDCKCVVTGGLILSNLFFFVKMVLAIQESVPFNVNFKISDPFTVSLVLPFPECHLDGIIQYIA